MGDSVAEGREAPPMALPVPEVVHIFELDAAAAPQSAEDGAQKSFSANPHEGQMSVSLAKSSSVADLSFATRSAGNASHSSARCGIRFKDDTPECMERAAVMTRMYPIMAVKETPFHNTIQCLSSSDDAVPSMYSGYEKKGASGTDLGEGEPSENSLNMPDSGPQTTPQMPAAVLGVAAKLKRACMWQTAIVNFLACRAWVEGYRRSKLRAVLEQHLLPVILRKRGKTNTSGKFPRRVCNEKPQPVYRNPDEPLQGSYLYEKVPILNALRSLKFCDILAETVSQYYYGCGMAVATAGTPEQDALYILVSGKCDCITPACETDPNVRRRRMQPGEVFGGIFGGNALFSSVYRCISKCLIWVITRESFEEAFTLFADSSMNDIFLAELRQHEMDRLKRLYPIRQCMSRVPIYRKSEQLSGQINEYIKGFTPVVMLRGEVIFEQGDQPGAVYCLTEGHVLREQAGLDMKYEGGTRQVLAPNEANNNFSLSTRFLLLGEESHILPGSLRYRCTVVSRAALLYKIDPESFVNMLLDDANLLIKLRQKYKEQLKQWMRISPDALRQVPILSEIPRHHLNAIIHVAEPRVLERYTAVCEPAQAIREIYVLTKGDVRDPRQFDHVPTLPPTLPPAEVESAEEEAPTKQRKDKPVKGAVMQRDRTGKGQKNGALPIPARKNNRPQKIFDARDSSGNIACNDVRVEWGFSDDMDLLKATVYPDERQEVTPPLPLNPERSIVCTIGGGWEGLLLEKWPTGWETTTTVELWAIPVMSIRTEFNSLPKAMQNSILRCISEVQMRELDLPAPLKVKLPPMSIYAPLEKRLTKTNLNGEKRIVRSPRHVKSSLSHDHSANATTGKIAHFQNDTTQSNSSFTTKSSSYLSADATACTKNRSSMAMSPLKRDVIPPKSVRPAPSKRLASPKKTRQVTLATNEEQVAEIPKSKAGPPALLLIRRLTKKAVEEAPKITPELRAMYAGTKTQKGIIRESSPLKGKQAREFSVSTALSDTAVSWPVLTDKGKRWFPMVTSFAPLPGTLGNTNQSIDPPLLLPNTSHMALRSRKSGETLESQVAYFTALANSKCLEGPNAFNASYRSAAKPYQLHPVASTGSHIGVVVPTPGRYAYRL